MVLPFSVLKNMANKPEDFERMISMIFSATAQLADWMFGSGSFQIFCLKRVMIYEG